VLRIILFLLLHSHVASGSFSSHRKFPLSADSAAWKHQQQLKIVKSIFSSFTEEEEEG